jgi:hypothetical protein
MDLRAVTDAPHCVWFAATAGFPPRLFTYPEPQLKRFEPVHRSNDGCWPFSQQNYRDLRSLGIKTALVTAASAHIR